MHMCVQNLKLDCQRNCARLGNDADHEANELKKAAGNSKFNCAACGRVIQISFTDGCTTSLLHGTTSLHWLTKSYELVSWLAMLFLHQSFQPCERVLNSRYARANTNT